MNAKLKAFLIEPIILLIGFTYYILVNSKIELEIRGKYWLLLSIAGSISVFGTLFFARMEWSIHESHKLFRRFLYQSGLYSLYLIIASSISIFIFQTNHFDTLSILFLSISIILAGSSFSHLVKFGLQNQGYFCQIFTGLILLIYILMKDQLKLVEIILLSIIQSIILFISYSILLVKKNLIIDNKKTVTKLFNLKYFLSDITHALGYRYVASIAAINYSLNELGLIRNIFFFIDILHKFPRILLMFHKADVSNGKNINTPFKNVIYYLLFAGILVLLILLNLEILSKYWDFQLNKTSYKYLTYGIVYGIYLLSFYPRSIEKNFPFNRLIPIGISIILIFFKLETIAIIAILITVIYENRTYKI